MDAFPISSDLLGKSASAYEHLRRAITHGHLRPGRRLSAIGLAATFRISETPVREALVRLSTEGFLTWEASKGHFTKMVTLEEQSDLHEVIAISLNACLQHLDRSRRGVWKDIEPRIAQVFAESAESVDAGQHMARLTAEVGAAVVRGSGNEVLRSIMAILMDRTQLVRQLALDTPERIVQMRLRIEGLASAVLAADAATAIAITGQHLAERRGRLPELVDAAKAVVARATYP